jgi:hypothetical protein
MNVGGGGGKWQWRPRIEGRRTQRMLCLVIERRDGVVVVLWVFHNGEKEMGG